MDTLTVEEAVQKLSKLIALANQDNCQFRITSEEGTAVMLSEEAYQNLLVTLELLSTPGLFKGVKLFNTEHE